MNEPATYEQAEALICEFYNDTWAQDDPDWWADMIEFVTEHRTLADARQWFESAYERRSTR